MPKINIKEPKGFTRVNGIEVDKLYFVDNILTKVILKNDVRVEFSTIHKKTAEKILKENRLAQKWEMSEEEKLELLDKKFKAQVAEEKKNKKKVPFQNKDKYSQHTKYLLKA